MGTLQVASLDWRDVARGQARHLEAERFDTICWADCVHWPELFEPLIKALERLAGKETMIYFAVAERGRVSGFLELMSKAFATVEVWKSEPTVSQRTDGQIII